MERRWAGNVKLRGPFRGLSDLPDLEGVLALLLDTHLFRELGFLGVENNDKSLKIFAKL